MKSYLFSKSTFISLGLFWAFLACFYGWMQVMHHFVPLHVLNYRFNAHHYLVDPRIQGKPFSLLSALDQYDVQWYLKIADIGYPARPHFVDVRDKTHMDGLTYAFFPLYPLLLAVMNLCVHNITIAAFMLTLLLVSLNFLSLRFVLSQWFGRSVGERGTWLFVLLPMSIFLYAPYSDNVRLLGLVWFIFFLTQKKFVQSAVMLALTNMVSATSWLLAPVLLVIMYSQKKSWQSIIWSLVTLGLPVSLWILYNLYQTGDPLYFLHVRQFGWAYGMLPFVPFLLDVSNFFLLPLHNFHYSQIDVLVAIAGITALIAWWKELPKPLAWVCLLIWATPLMVSDTMSYARYSLGLFPLVGFLAQKLSFKKYVSLLIISGGLLLMTSLFFINWWWIG